MTSTLAGTDPFALAVTSGEVLLSFFGVYGFVFGVRFEFHHE